MKSAQENGTSKKEAAGGSNYSVPAIDKALDVLELLGDSAQGMSLTGIADALGRTKQELFRVLICLNERGYLVRDENQHYRLTMKMFEIGSQHASTQSLIARAMPHMERLVSLLGQSCHLNIVVQNKMLVITKVECDADIMLTVRVGATFELHRRNSGLIGLALQPEYRTGRYWGQAGISEEEVAKCEDKMTQFRKKGFAEASSPAVIGVQDCAAPILGSGSGLLAVLCVSYIKRLDGISESHDLMQEVVSCAQAISAEFGPVESSVVNHSETVSK
ncbi:MAG: IclR family transcriptional regulator [Planctomycetaceae bacterium]|nr:IclR family transcriptional regulator [Planctomycetaceae bacterium]